MHSNTHKLSSYGTTKPFKTVKSLIHKLTVTVISCRLWPHCNRTSADPDGLNLTSAMLQWLSLLDDSINSND